MRGYKIAVSDWSSRPEEARLHKIQQIDRLELITDGGFVTLLKNKEYILMDDDGTGKRFKIIPKHLHYNSWRTVYGM